MDITKDTLKIIAAVVENAAEYETTWRAIYGPDLAPPDRSANRLATLATVQTAQVQRLGELIGHPAATVIEAVAIHSAARTKGIRPERTPPGDIVEFITEELQDHLL